MSRAARVGAFLIVTVAILAVGIFIVGSKKYLFTDTFYLKTQFTGVMGLEEGAEVRVGGVHRGTVRSIALPAKPNEKITVEMDLDSSTRNIIRKDSTASIETEGLLGNEYMAISFGSADAGTVKNGDMIASQQPLAIADLLKKANGLLDSSQDVLSNVSNATANLSSVSAKIDRGQGTVGALINDKKVYNELDQTVSGVKDTVAHAQAGVADFQEDMEALKHNFLLSGFFKKRGYEDATALEKDEIVQLPQAEPIKQFTFDAKRIFDKETTAKLKNQKSMAAAGDFLAKNGFGLAVIAAYTSMEGDSAKDQVLTEGRAEVVRQYLVDNFHFDDTHLKTLGLGKKVGVSPATGWGSVEVLVYPAGTEIPPDKVSTNKNRSEGSTIPPARGLLSNSLKSK